MPVNALAGVATPANTAENLVSLGAILGLLKQRLPVGTDLVVMASNGLLKVVSRVSIVNGVWELGRHNTVPRPRPCYWQGCGTTEASPLHTAPSTRSCRCPWRVDRRPGLFDRESDPGAWGECKARHP